MKRKVVDDTGTTSPVYIMEHPNPYVESVDPDGVYVVICAVCGKNNRRADDNMPYFGGKWYHGESCYKTLFGRCDECSSEIFLGELPENLCRKCYMKKHGLGIRVIAQKF